MSKPDDSVRVAPLSERESDVLAHLNMIKSLKHDIDFYEGMQKVTRDEQSNESLGRSVETLQRAQGRLYQSLNVRYGIDTEKADKIIGGKISEADMLTAFRERVAMYGYGAVKAFDNSGQFDAGILKDLSNRAVNVRDTPEVPQASAQAQKQAAASQTEQEKIVANLLELSKREKKINKQIADSGKTLNPEGIRALEQERDQKRREYKENFAEVVKRPDKEQIMKLMFSCLR